MTFCIIFQTYRSRLQIIYKLSGLSFSTWKINLGMKYDIITKTFTLLIRNNNCNIDINQIGYKLLKKRD